MIFVLGLTLTFCGLFSSEGRARFIALLGVVLVEVEDVDPLVVGVLGLAGVAGCFCIAAVGSPCVVDILEETKEDDVDVEAEVEELDADDVVVDTLVGDFVVATREPVMGC